MSYRIIQHEVSKYGRLDIAFYKESLELLSILERDGLIEYLQDLDHLGFVSKSHPGNNHKRWDYMCLQFNILQQLRHSSFGLGLNSNNVRVEGTENDVSKIVFLQVCILFSNIGHLVGTIAAEKALVSVLRYNEDIRNSFNSHISVDQDCEDWVNNIIVENDFYKAKYIVALNYIFCNVENETIRGIIKMFFLNPISGDNARIKQLKSIFFKIRQISFVYLDSFNSDFPFQIDITKILLNIFCYPTLFNPNSRDFDQFFDACETTLTKKMYLSEASIRLLDINEKEYKKHLLNEHNKSGINALNWTNFIISINQKRRKKFEIKQSGKIEVYQFYISKQDNRLFGRNVVAFFNYNKARETIYSNESSYSRLINKGLRRKVHTIRVLHDQRKTLYYLNLLYIRDKIDNDEFTQFLHNYVLVHHSFLSSFSSELNHQYSELAKGNLMVSYVRKVFLQLFKILFKIDQNTRLNIYTLNQYNEVAEKMFSQIRPPIFPTGFEKGKQNFRNKVQSMLAMSDIPSDIKNSLGILKSLIEKSKIGTHCNYYYKVLPTQITSIKKDPTALNERGNPEVSEDITDIDLSLIIFNNTKVEFYIVEGKNTSGFQSQVRNDFETKVKPNLNFQSVFPEIEFNNEADAKGGYIVYRNFT